MCAFALRLKLPQAMSACLTRVLNDSFLRLLARHTSMMRNICFYETRAPAQIALGDHAAHALLNATLNKDQQFQYEGASTMQSCDELSSRPKNARKW